MNIKKLLNLKLEIELVPQSSHYNNLRYLITKSEWNKLRKEIIPPLDNKCEICGGKSPGKRSLDLHEVWEYDLKTNKQKLKSLQGLCIYCHEVKHFYLAKINNKEKRARKRLIKINNLTEEECNFYEYFIHQQFLERSQFNWTLDNSLLKKFPFIKF